PARLTGSVAGARGRQKDLRSRLDRYRHPEGRDCEAVLILCLGCVSDSRSPDAHIERALAAMADMGFLKPDHQRAEFRQAEAIPGPGAAHTPPPGTHPPFSSLC